MNYNFADLTFDLLKLDLSSRKLFVGRIFVSLRNKEFSLLEYFIKNTGVVLSRTRILEDVWDRNIICPTNTVDVHVSNLRKKLEKHECSDFIKTVHCIGYIFES